MFCSWNTSFSIKQMQKAKRKKMWLFFSSNGRFHAGETIDPMAQILKLMLKIEMDFSGFELLNSIQTPLKLAYWINRMAVWMRKFGDEFTFFSRFLRVPFDFVHSDNNFIFCMFLLPFTFLPCAFCTNFNGLNEIFHHSPSNFLYARNCIHFPDFYLRSVTLDYYLFLLFGVA